MPAQIKRLALLFVVLIGLFLIVRMVLVPDTFGEYGHYRGASLDDNKAVEAKFVGEDACLDCHDDIGQQKDNDLHTEISCESCHGPGWKHIEEPEASNIEHPEGREFCGLCHSLNAARPRNIVAQVDFAEHNLDFNCIDCHNPHAPWE